MSKYNTIFAISQEPLILQFSYGVEHANTYVVMENNHALVIDSCSKAITKELRTRCIIPDYLILTHEHCDHLWGLNAIRDAFQNIKVIAQKNCSEAIGNPKKNKAKQYHIYTTLRFGEEYYNEEAINMNYSCKPADIVFDEEEKFTWHGWKVYICHAPGHSPGSVLVSIQGIGIFSGDTILLEDTFLKFDGGDEEEFNCITMPIIRRIPDSTRIFPGHGDVFRMGECRYR